MNDEPRRFVLFCSDEDFESYPENEVARDDDTALLFEKAELLGRAYNMIFDRHRPRDKPIMFEIEPAPALELCNS